jgi:hypothetical protein
MICVSVSALQAVDPIDSFVMMDILRRLREEPKAAPETPAPKNGKVFAHAEIAPSGAALPSAVEGLKGQQSDLTDVMGNEVSKSLESANIPSSDARVALQQEETKEDLKLGPISEQKPNGDETLNQAELDLKLGRPNPSAGIVRNAELINVQ